MSTDKVMSALGLAMRAGKIVSGVSGVEKAVRSDKACLMLIASDASETSKKDYINLADYYKVPYSEVLTKIQLGLCIGKAPRAALVIVDKGFAQMVSKLLV